MNSIVYDQMTGLSTDGGIAFYRRQPVDGSRATLIRMVEGGTASPEQRERLANEFTIAVEFGDDWSVRPIELIDDGNGLALILNDPGGELLTIAPHGNTSLSAFLALSIRVTDAVSRLHSLGIIHGDLRPANILVDDDAGRVYLTGFGASCRDVSRKRLLTATQPSASALAYLSPEATGRMNRSIDRRSDLYSLGVTLYEMLTGRLPFIASSPSQWIESHIARDPVPPGMGMRGLPTPIAEILLKLLAKTPEDRYQSAIGLRSDLLRCLEGIDQKGRIENFDLADRDTPDWIYISERLYGRRLEVARLSTLYEEVADRGTTDVVLVSGLSGIGKSAAVAEFQRQLIVSEALFASGKCDQSGSNAPYATLAAAFESFFCDIVARGETAIVPWRQSLSIALGSNAQLLCDLIPALGLILGPQPPIQSLPPREASYRFYTVFKKLVGALSNASHPFVLCIDDLQWIDGSTLSLLVDLVVDPEIRYFLLLGTYRSNEVGEAHPLSVARSRISAAGMTVKEISLDPLRLDNMIDFTADCLRESREDVRELGEVIYTVTGGNPFFARQLIAILMDGKLIWFDERAGRWSWSIERIRSRASTYDVTELLAPRLIAQSSDSQLAIQTLACLGRGSESETLGHVLGVSRTEIDRALVDIVQWGLVQRTGSKYFFVHDKVQEAAYAMIAPQERAARHIGIARALVFALPQDALEERIFDVADQVNLGAEHVVTPEERIRAADLNLRAAKNARGSSAHASYHQYLRAGAAFLVSDAWESHFDLAFDFEFHLSESEFLLGDLTAAEERLLELKGRARSLAENGEVTWLLITCLTTAGRFDRAIQVCLEFLRSAGIDWSPHPTQEALSEEFAPILGEIENGTLLRRRMLPELENPVQRIVLDVLTAVLPPAFFTDNNLVCLVLCRMANISRRFGNSDASSLGYAYLGMTLGPTFNQWKAGYQFGDLGFRLSNHRGPDPFKARVQMAFSYHVMPYSRPIRESWPLHREAFDLAKDIGDLTYAGFSSCTLVSSLLFAGAHLEEVQTLAESRIQFAVGAKFGLIEEIVSTQWRLAKSYRGETSGFPSLDGDGFDEQSYERHLQESPELAIAACWYWIRKVELRFVGGDLKGAIDAARTAEPLVWTSGGHLELVEFYFFAGLAHAGCYTICDQDKRQEHMARLLSYAEKLRVMAAHCPSNFGARSALLDGELARIEGRQIDAFQSYEKAIELARIDGFPQVEAIANEIAAILYRASNLSGAAAAYLTSSRDCFLKYGALAKARQIEARFPEAISSASSTGAGLAGSVDAYLNAVLRTSEAVSEGADVDALIGTLLKTVLESSGADRVLLLLPNGDELRLEAEAKHINGQVEIKLHRVELRESHAPMSVVNYAASTRDMFNVLDVNSDGDYQRDPYLLANGIRSVLCLPLSKQARLIGVLYLESTSTVRAFTAARVRLLQLISSLVAVTLENASLEEKESLLREVHHRVKNNLQLITSLLNLQSARISDPAVAELFEESRNRVRSMALVHENLYRTGNLARISMRPHIEGLCSQLFRIYGTNQQRVGLELAVEDIQIDLDRAVSCGLLINELVSNSLKYAFADDRQGRIRVALRRISDTSIELSVEDDGVGIVDVGMAKRSLGLQLIEDLAHQLRATVETRSEGGLRTLVRFSLNGDGCENGE